MKENKTALLPVLGGQGMEAARADMAKLPRDPASGTLLLSCPKAIGGGVQLRLVKKYTYMGIKTTDTSSRLPEIQMRKRQPGFYPFTKRVEEISGLEQLTRV